MAEKKKDTGVRMGVEVNKKIGKARDERLARATELASNGQFAKVRSAGKTKLHPVNRIYEVEEEDRGEGYEVEDKTVEGEGKYLPDSPVDAAQRKLGSPKGQASNSETPVEEVEGTPETATEGAGEASEGQEAFDPTDPEAVPLADLEEALKDLDEPNLRVAADHDSRKGAKEIYEKLLSSE